MGINQKIQTFLEKGFWAGIWYAAREIILIVVGVLIAVWIDNLNDERKDRALEIKTLNALKIGLQQDSSDIELNIKGLTEMTEWRRKVMLVSEGKMSLDSLNGEAPISSYTFFLNNIAPYENLKSVGLSKITNDSLRNQIITLFELDYKNLMRVENEINVYKTEQLNHYSELGVYHFYQEKPLLDFLSMLRKDKNFIFVNFITWQKERLQLNWYAILQTKLNRLIRNVETECKRK
jgi:hypothetical protein